MAPPKTRRARSKAPKNDEPAGSGSSPKEDSTKPLVFHKYIPAPPKPTDFRLMLLFGTVIMAGCAALGTYHLAMEVALLVFAVFCPTPPTHYTDSEGRTMPLVYSVRQSVIWECVIVILLAGGWANPTLPLQLLSLSPFVVLGSIKIWEDHLSGPVKRMLAASYEHISSINWWDRLQTTVGYPFYVYAMIRETRDEIIMKGFHWVKKKEPLTQLKLVSYRVQEFAAFVAPDLWRAAGLVARGLKWLFLFFSAAFVVLVLIGLAVTPNDAQCLVTV